MNLRHRKLRLWMLRYAWEAPSWRAFWKILGDWLTGRGPIV